MYFCTAQTTVQCHLWSSKLLRAACVPAHAAWLQNAAPSPSNPPPLRERSSPTQACWILKSGFAMRVFFLCGVMKVFSRMPCPRKCKFKGIASDGMPFRPHFQSGNLFSCFGSPEINIFRFWESGNLVFSGFRGIASDGEVFSSSF